MDITNDDQLNKIMGDIVEKVIDKVSLYILDDLKEMIMIDTYLSHGPNKIYSPTYEFLNSFEWKNIEKNTRNVSRTMFNNWMGMRSDPSTYTHAQYPSGEDTRNILADLLNIDGVDASSEIGVMRKPFWDDTIRDLFDGKKIDNYFLQEFSQYGIYGS